MRTLSFCLTGKWTRGKPTLAKVQSYIKRSNWSGNCISAEEVLQSWTAPSQSTLDSDRDLVRHVTEQSWTGLMISGSRKAGAGKGRFLLGHSQIPDDETLLWGFNTPLGVPWGWGVFIYFILFFSFVFCALHSCTRGALRRLEK